MSESNLIKVLALNSVKCLCCGEVLVSKNHHHYVVCNCDNKTFVDGGLDYSRYGGKDLDNVEVLSKYLYMTKDEHEELLKSKGEI